jgi:50S ribosomal protein L16 3-hydroxylase
VQGVDLHDEAVHHLMQGFRFVPDARLDDLMISYASNGGGVGPHFDSYDVFLLQAHGRRRWRIGRQTDLSLRDDTPLKVLAHFEPEEEYVLEPGDMLYLPPRYAHDGIAEGECMTYSIGFRSPKRGELARELLQRLAEDADDLAGEQLYRDASQPAVADPAAIPAGLHEFAADALQRVLNDPDALARVIGEAMTDPKPQVWFEAGAATEVAAGVRLDRRTRMLHDERHVFINGEVSRRRRDAALMRQLANLRVLGARRGAAERRRARALDRVVPGRLAAPPAQRVLSRDGSRIASGLSPVWPFEGRFEGREAFAERIRARWPRRRRRAGASCSCAIRFRGLAAGRACGDRGAQAWARGGRRLLLLAARYDELRRRHHRFVQWRRTWDHLIEAARGRARPPSCPVCCGHPIGCCSDWIWSCTGVCSRRAESRWHCANPRRMLAPQFPAFPAGPRPVMTVRRS